jgi:hypothetical protein
VMRHQFRPVVLLWAGFLPASLVLDAGWAAPRRPVLPDVALPSAVVLVLAAVAFAVLARRSFAVLAALTFLAAAAAVANQSYAGAANREPLALVANGIAGEIAQLDPTDAGDARRCELRDRFAKLTAGFEYGPAEAAGLLGTRTPAERLDVVLDMATVQMYGVPFCARSL